MALPIGFPSPPLSLVHPTLQLPRDDLVLRDDVHDSAPPGHRVPVHAAQQRLRERLEELVGAHVRPEERLAHPVHVSRARSRHDEVLRVDGGADEVHPAQEGLPRLLVEAGHDRLDEVRAEPLLVQDLAEQVGEDLGGHLPLLLEPVQVQPELEQVVQRLDVRGEPPQAHVQLGGHPEDLGEVGRDRVELHAEASVRGDAHAALAGHGDDGGSVVFQDRHGGAVRSDGSSRGRRVSVVRSVGKEIEIRDVSSRCVNVLSDGVVYGKMIEMRFAVRDNPTKR
jgi:hypothetical protein